MIFRRWSLHLIIFVSLALLGWTEASGVVVRNTLFYRYGLSADGLAVGHWQTFLTHAFLHGSLWHGLFNLAGLWVVGNYLCERHGAGFFLAVFFAGVFAGGLAQTAANPQGVLVGASGGVFALVVAAGFLSGDRRVGLRLGHWRFAAFRGTYLGWGVLAASLLTLLVARILPAIGPVIGHACHAGAAVAGAMIFLLARVFAPPAEKIFAP